MDDFIFVRTRRVVLVPVEAKKPRRRPPLLLRVFAALWAFMSLMVWANPDAGVELTGVWQAGFWFYVIILVLDLHACRKK